MKKLAILFILFFSFNLWAWGGRGHAVICEAAVHLVKSPELKNFLMSRPHLISHLCNIPDIYWKSIPSDLRKLGDPGHYINAEKIGLKLGEIPTDYKKIVATYTGKPNKENESQTLYSIPDELGSSWWRADQFYKLASEAATSIKNHPEPKGYAEEQNADLPYNKSVYQMMVNMGLLGHFVGDTSQPFHNTSDHDGYAANHGGIHSYYEEGVIAEFGPDLTNQIVKKAKSWKSQSFTQKSGVIENMRALSEVSAAEAKDVLKVDPIITPSVIKIEKGMSIKTAAKRRPPSEALKKMGPIAIKHMARSSYLLAYFWDEIYKKSGEPSLKGYRSYLYPFTPDFVKPDYF